MSQKDELRRMKFGVKFETLSVANAAAFNTAHTTTNLDTQGFETNMFLLTVNTIGNTPDYVFKIYESDVSVTDAGTAASADDVIAVRSDNTNTKITGGVITETVNGDEGKMYIIEYTGCARWIRLQCTTGTKTATFGLQTLQMHARRTFYTHA
jgi:hypothetical protein